MSISSPALRSAHHLPQSGVRRPRSMTSSVCARTCQRSRCRLRTEPPLSRCALRVSAGRGAHATVRRPTLATSRCWWSFANSTRGSSCSRRAMVRSLRRRTTTVTVPCWYSSTPRSSGHCLFHRWSCYSGDSVGGCLAPSHAYSPLSLQSLHGDWATPTPVKRRYYGVQCVGSRSGTLE